MTANPTPHLDEQGDPHPAMIAGAAFSSTWRHPVLVCTGELDPGSNPDLRRELAQIGSGTTDPVVVDVAAVSFLDCGAVTEFQTARKSCRAAGGDLSLRSPTAMTRRLLGMLDLDDLIGDDTGGPTTSDGASVTFDLGGQLEANNRASVMIEQARGVIAGHFDVSMDDATDLLDTFARHQHEPLTTVASAVVDRTADLADLSDPFDRGWHSPDDGPGGGISTALDAVRGSTGGTA